MTEERDFALQCPLPISEYPRVLLAHGGGGKLSHQLLEKVFYPLLDNPQLAQRHDGAVFEQGGIRFAFTTDSYVVRPLIFPGGDICRLAVFGTVNDLAMCGARPLFLSVGLILEEGLPMETLWQLSRSLAQAAAMAGVQIVTGDTKVVDKGKGDGLFINSSGVGVIEHSLSIAPQSVRPGDAVILSGDIGRHGIAVLAVREGLEFETTIASDCAPLAGLVGKLLAAGIELHCLRDLTRGGLAAAMVEIAGASGKPIEIEEAAVPVTSEVQAACEILGLDPMFVANEGRFIAFVPDSAVSRSLEIMRADTLGAGAGVIGRVIDDGQPGVVTVRNRLGRRRILDLPSGEQLPRIC